MIIIRYNVTYDSNQNESRYNKLFYEHSNIFLNILCMSLNVFFELTAKENFFLITNNINKNSTLYIFIL